jgi:formylglycine-generating enzyme required for sulfatase activity
MKAVPSPKIKLAVCNEGLMKRGRFVLGTTLVILVVLGVACSGNDRVAVETGAMPPCTAAGQTWTSPIDGATLNCVPAGEFLMGTADDDRLASDDERPQHRVYLDAYWIDRTEVANAEFARCMAAGACRPDVYDTAASTYVPYAVHPDYQNYPALLYEVDVAAAYCQWAGRRLPTEAEWEKAARGTVNRRFPWGNDIDCSHATYFDCVRNTVQSADSMNGPRCGYSYFCPTVQVDAHPAGASPYGPLNMAGNVWEWVADWYSPDYYSISPATNPTGPAAGEYRVLRGGGAKSFERDLHVTARARGSASHFFDGQLGFRCAITATK